MRNAFLILCLMNLVACEWFDETVYNQSARNEGQDFFEVGDLAAPAGAATILSGTNTLENTIHLSEADKASLPQEISFYNSNSGTYKNSLNQLETFSYYFDETQKANLSNVCIEGSGSYSRYFGEIKIAGVTHELVVEHINGDCPHSWSTPTKCFIVSLDDEESYYFEKTAGGCDGFINSNQRVRELYIAD